MIPRWQLRLMLARPIAWRAAVVWAAAVLGGAVVSAPVAAAKQHHKPSVHAAAHAKPTRRKIARAAHSKLARTRLAAATPPPESKPSAEVLPPAPPVKILLRDDILNSGRDRLERLGHHIIVGYQSLPAIRDLVEKRAIAGVFITDHNVRGRTAADIKSDIDALQAIRTAQALPPLIIAADQEGGTVSRLSPPLRRQPSLAHLLAGLNDDAARRAAVEAYAEIQAADLKRIGVTLNFAPVVDLNIATPNRDDGETRLGQRAIAADPFLVSKVAGWYCDTLAKSGLMCTLKHFPGLGRVARDTHVASGEISASEGQLELNDWVPFRRVMIKPNVATMLGHVRVGAIDKTTPASFSKLVIAGLIRDRWQYDGLLVTDDFSMGAITRGQGGPGAAAVQSLNAGVDLILLSYSEEHYDAVMSALIAADSDDYLDGKVREISRDRIARILDPSHWSKPD